MSGFESKWMSWEEGEGSGDAIKPPQETSPGAGLFDTYDQGACKTPKSPFDGFAGSLTEDVEGASLPRTVADMTLDTFARAGLIVRVESAVLGCSVLFVSDDVPDSDLTAASLPVYRAVELRKLAVLKPDHAALRRLHDLKQIFNGGIANAE